MEMAMAFDAPLGEPEDESGPAQQLPEETDVYRRVHVPRHRNAALRAAWPQLVEPVVNQLKIQIRYNTRMHVVELHSSPETVSPVAMQKSVDFIKAFVIGFDIPDALALVRLDDIFFDEFDVEDIKLLRGNNLDRAVGRIAGKGGEVKFSIENATRTRICLNDKHVHIIGTHSAIRMARRMISNLVMGTPASKVQGKLRGYQTWLKRHE